MGILLIHPNYHSGGAEIAGNWPPAWVAYLAGQHKSAGYRDIGFIDAMTDHIEHDKLEQILREERPDVVLCTAITPAIYKVEVRDSAKYNFVTPIIQPETMTRDEVLAGVLKNYRRFYFKKATGGYLWDKDPYRRKYLRGCLKAYLKSAVERRFYDLGRINY